MVRVWSSQPPRGAARPKSVTEARQGRGCTRGWGAHRPWRLRLSAYKIPRYCRWIDVVGRNRTKLERVRERLALPQRLVPLTLSEHLYPSAIRVRPAWFLVTYFTSPSPRRVFQRHPVFLWIADYSIVTISPWAHRQGLLGDTHRIHTTRDGLVCRVVEAAVASHGEVGRKLNDALVGHRGDNHFEWHSKQRRLVRFTELLDQQLEFLLKVGISNRKMRQAHDDLERLIELVRHADRKLRRSGYCRLCRRNEVLELSKGR